MNNISMPRLINKTMASGADTTVAIIPFNDRNAFSLMQSFNQGSGNLVAALALAVSNDYIHPVDGDAAKVVAATARANWDSITDPAIVAWLTTDAAASPPGGKPAGIAGTGFLQVDPLRCAAIKFTVTWSSGSGVFTASVEME